MKPLDADVIVVGAGMVGAAFAAALAESRLSVALIDAGPPPALLTSDHYDLRVSAISPGTQSILQAVGAWERLDSSRIEPYQSMYVWDASSRGSIRFDAAELGVPWLGHIIENSNIHHALLRSLDAAANIHYRFDTPPASLDITEGRCRLLLKGGGAMAARLVVGADGAGSWLRSELGIPVKSRLYGQRAFVCEVRTERPHQRTAWQRFLPTGPVAFLPLANGGCSVVWTCDAALAAELEALDAAVFGERLAGVFDGKLGGVEVVGAVRGFDLARRQASSYVVERAALIGDAAHVVHPMAGQGANLGFGDAWSLASVLLRAESEERDIGRRHVLRRYERWRRSENFSMIRMLDGLHVLFSSDSGIVRGARGLGLDAVDRGKWLKHVLARQALGEPVPGTSGGELPEFRVFPG
ncbi:MAG: UbiH/UbiF/VisC/COQ6 family ubiquinone biosynthesis hydroxylase [Gammaproteobacteria bacterium]|nr:UbiH/UbiF/VisC/COQ6 family ubiquinone biosynthesis hydroxylase [Gammaproteobacteria bacterium]